MTDTTALNQPLYGATFGQAISRFFKKYATFSGRASRSEYWWAVLAIGLIEAVLYTLAIVVGISTGTPSELGDGVTLGAPGVIFLVLLGLFTLAVIIPGIAVTVRRLHDGNFSGWFYLLSLTGIGSVIVFVFTLLPSNPEGRRFDI